MKRELKYYTMPTNKSVPDAIVLANGDFPKHPLPLALLKKAKQVICCDGAADKYYKKRKKLPTAIIGDGDSLSPENKAKFSSIVFYTNDSDTNDLTQAVRYCQAQRIKTLYILGATGKREDHTIANISLLGEYMDDFDEILIITDYGVFTPIKIDSQFESFAGQAVSVFSIKAAPVRGRGLKYPLATLSSWWQGTRNEANSDVFTILARDKTIVFQTHLEDKK